MYHCIKCGLCLAGCPVYAELREEAVAPRGHVQHLRAFLEGRLELSPYLREVTSLCLLCQGCTALCPSGLALGELFAGFRSEMVKRFGLPPRKRLLFQMLHFLHQMPDWARSFQGFFHGLLPVNFKLRGISLATLPPLAKASLTRCFPERTSPDGTRARVIYYPGCIDDHIYPETGEALIEVLRSLQVEVVLPRGMECCGLPMYTSGGLKEALEKADHNLPILASFDANAILTTCSSCGLMLKQEYTQLYREMGRDPSMAEEVGAKVKDIAEYLMEIADLDGRLRPLNLRVTYHDPCHLAKGLGVRREPRALLKQIPGLEFLEMSDADACCGSGGSFMFDYPALADKIASKKAQNILFTGAEVVATGCPACRMQLVSKTRRLGVKVEVVHTIQLLRGSLREKETRY